MDDQAGNDVTTNWQRFNQSEHSYVSSRPGGSLGVLSTTGGVFPDYLEDNSSGMHSNNSGDYDIDHAGAMIFARGFYKYGVPVIYGIGIPSNVIVIIVLLSKTYKWTSFSINLVILAVANTLVLISALLEHVTYLTGIAILSSSKAVCLITTYIFFIAKPLSNMILAYIMVERAIVISYPVYSIRKLTRRRIFICISCIFGFLAVYYLPVFYAYGLVKNPDFPDEDAHCGYPVKHEYWADYYFVGWGRALLWNIIPLTVILASGVVMTVKLWPRRKQSSAMNMLLRDTTIMLLTVGICFFLTTVVQTVDEVGFDLGIYNDQYSGYLASEVMIIMGPNLALINHAINILLYCAVGRRFRTAFIVTMCRCNKESVPSSSDDQRTYTFETLNETVHTLDEEGMPLHTLDEEGIPLT